MGENYVNPLQGALKADLHPTRGISDGLTEILHPPALHKADVYGAHFGELANGLVPNVDRLSQLLGKVLVVKDGHVATYKERKNGLTARNFSAKKTSEIKTKLSRPLRHYA